MTIISEHHELGPDPASGRFMADFDHLSLSLETPADLGIAPTS